jgi:ubiquinone biosynthesis accessory factor UbiK
VPTTKSTSKQFVTEILTGIDDSHALSGTAAGTHGTISVRGSGAITHGKIMLFSLRFSPMLDAKLFDEIANKLSALIAATPAKDVEKNLRALLVSTLARFDLVTREEFEIQRETLVRAREKLAALEAQVAALEERLGRQPKP